MHTEINFQLSFNLESAEECIYLAFFMERKRADKGFMYILPALSLNDN